ncbi:MAG: hypothetical protein ACK5ZX_05245 [Bacteroidota bacterium]
MKVEDVIKWCDEKSQDGSEVAICWEGGGDSGWVYMEVDGEQASSEEADWLVDRMCDILDYGSWAGEFNASGRAIYDSETKVFEGDDVYSEDTSEEIELKDDQIIKIKIPKKYFLEELRVEFENVLDGGCVSILPIVKNGIINCELPVLCKNMEDEIRDKEVEILSNATSSDYSGWQIENFVISELENEDPDNHVINITRLEYTGYSEDIRGVFIDLNEYAEELNDEEL